MKPPFEITPKILELCTEITRLLGRYEGLKSPTPPLLLRRQNRIRTIQSSLAIEGNSLTEEQVTTLLDNKLVIGPPKDILEVKNAIKTYNKLKTYIPHSRESLLDAHATLMKDLISKAGQLRMQNVGVFKGDEVVHQAPPPRQVPELLDHLLSFVKAKDELHPLVKSSIFHYEFEFIHPFSDGNGRMGRLWQTVILLHYHPIFEYLPVEPLIKQKQDAYYRALSESDNSGHSTVFIKFILEAILEVLHAFLAELKVTAETAASRLSLAKEYFQNQLFTRRDYLRFQKNISSATASRDLAWGVHERMLEKKGNKALTQYRFV